MGPEPVNEFEIYARALKSSFPILLTISCLGTLAILAWSFNSPRTPSFFRTLHLAFGSVAVGVMIVSACRITFLELTYISGDPIPFRWIGDLVILTQIVGGYLVFVGLSTAATLIPKSKHNKTAIISPIPPRVD